MSLQMKPERFRSMVQICRAVCLAAALVQMQNELDRPECLWRPRPGLLSPGFAGLCLHGYNSSGLELVLLSNTVRTHHLVLRHFNNTRREIKKRIGSPRSVYTSLQPLRKLLLCFMMENIWLQCGNQVHIVLQPILLCWYLVKSQLIVVQRIFALNA